MHGAKLWTSPRAGVVLCGKVPWSDLSQQKIFLWHPCGGRPWSNNVVNSPTHIQWFWNNLFNVPPTQEQRTHPIPLYSLTYSPGRPWGQPWGNLMACALHAASHMYFLVDGSEYLVAFVTLPVMLRGSPFTFQVVTCTTICHNMVSSMKMKWVFRSLLFFCWDCIVCLLVETFDPTSDLSIKTPAHDCVKLSNQGFGHFSLFSELEICLRGSIQVSGDTPTLPWVRSKVADLDGTTLTYHCRMQLAQVMTCMGLSQGFETCFKILQLFSSCMQQCWGSCEVDLHEAIRVVWMTWASCMRQL